MNAIEILLLLAVAALCGALGQALAGYSRGGCLVAIVLGFIGALLGSWLSRLLDLPELFTVTVDDVEFPLIWSVIGSALFVALLGMLQGPRSRRDTPA